MSNNPHPDKMAVNAAEFAHDLDDEALLTYFIDNQIQLPEGVRSSLVYIAADMKLDELQTEPEPDI